MLTENLDLDWPAGHQVEVVVRQSQSGILMVAKVEVKVVGEVGRGEGQ